ncbi:hydroxymethylbilane synthase [Flavobacteriaceae bacterium]|nr:hydroxymethylbilane synthase [Flavobacteriaceae bacterium]
MNSPLRIGTRESPLALWQANNLQEKLKTLGIVSTLVAVKSQGDLDLTQPLYSMGITGIFTKTLDSALLNKTVDIAIHSMKDVPTLLPEGIVQTAVLKRGLVMDVMVWKNKEVKKKKTRIIATGSLRRKAQWLALYPNDIVVPLRGNIQTRLEKLHSTNDWDGAIFAEAALERLAIQNETIDKLKDLIPAPAQGALMVVSRTEDTQIHELLAPLNDQESERCTFVERDFLRTLEGGCTAPIGALATYKKGAIKFTGGLYSLKGNKAEEVSATFPPEEYKEKGRELAIQLLAHGGANLMKEFKSNS